jgi:hypothetical protein
MTETRTADSLRALLANAVDYAGLFPPAGLGMREAVADYARYAAGELAWMLGRFVVPAARLDEFGVSLAGIQRAGAWSLSVLPGSDAGDEMRAALEFAGEHGVKVDAAELKAGSADEIARLGSKLPRGPRYYFEIPLEGDLPALAAAASAVGAGIKARTGGITADAFPAAEDIARFLEAAVSQGVPFKLTAGLHHPVRGEYRLTYEPDAACGMMFGFLNAFIATALAVARAGRSTVVQVLTETDVDSFSFAHDAVSWRGHTIDMEMIHLTRKLLHGFGSCSFTEPVDELQAAGLLR